jgi:hypothetical protein
MEWDHLAMLTAMGMDWDETSTDIEILDIPTLEFTAENDPYFATYGISMFDPPNSPKQQIISHDCMWSGTCGDKSHPAKMKSSDNVVSNSTNVSSSSVSATQQTAINNNSNDVNSCKINNSDNILINESNNKIVANNSAVNAATQNSNTVKQQNKIPAGRSLLLNSRTSGNSNNIISKQIQSCIAHTVVNDKGGTTTRPDTPLSLDDDSPEFKHHIDLAGTIAGTLNSNCSRYRTISDDSSHIITLLKEHLEDDDMQGQKSGQILEILSSTFGTNGDSNSDNVLDYLKYLSDYEDDSAVDMDSDSDSSGGSGYENSSSDKAEPYSNVSYDYQETHFGDHSYTRPKDKYDTRDLGVQTPSDSGKYILFIYNLSLFFTCSV